MNKRLWILFVLIFVIGSILVVGKLSRRKVKGVVKLTLLVEEQNCVLPKNPNEWFALKLKCRYENIGTKDIVFVDPEAYKIYPHPYMLKVNNQVAEFWGGSVECAPDFKEEDKISLKPGQTVERSFTWHEFMDNFKREPGIYKMSIKYDYGDKPTWTVGARLDRLTRMESEWSNELVVMLK